MPSPHSPLPPTTSPEPALSAPADASPTHHTTSQRTTTTTTTTTLTLTTTTFLSAPALYTNTHSLPFHIHGIIPGQHLHTSSSLSLPPTTPTLAPPPRTTLPPRHSHYPLASPPGFLYPTPIVPAAAHAAAQARHSFHDPLDTVSAIHHAGAHRSVLGRIDYTMAYLPPGLTVLLILVVGVMGAAVLWCGVVWMVNFPLGEWGCAQAFQSQTQLKKERTKHGRRTHEAQEQNNENREGIEMRSYATTTALDTCFSIGSSTPSQRTHTRSRITSPENPFLTPAHGSTTGLTSRTSSEWLHARAAFFESNSASPSRSPSFASTVSSWTQPDAADLSAIEAGTAPLSRFAAPLAGVTQQPTSDSEDNLLLKWIEGGLGMVDGAVDRVVGSVVRWGDNEGEELLLLPVVEGRV